MKKNLITALMLFISFATFGQTIIENPTAGFSTTSMLKIQKIEILDTATVIFVRIKGNPGTGFSIPSMTFIKPTDGNDKLYIKGTEGVAFNEQSFLNDSGEVNCKLIFPKINNTVRRIDYGEDNDGGNWFIYDIQLKQDKILSNVPPDLQGNWFNTLTGNWEISLFDTLVIYKGQPWGYNEIKLKKGKGSIKIKSKTEIIELFVNIDKNGILNCGESPQNLNNYSKDITKLNINNIDTTKPYEEPIFKMDSAVYCGYLKGYTKRIGGKTMSIYIDDIITGKQSSYTIEISDNGFFSIKLPLYYPHYTWVRSTFYNGSVFLEPGKTLFQMIDMGSYDSPFLFMGESAKINSDLLKLDKINSFNYYEMRTKIVDMSPYEYKTYCQNLQKIDYEALESIEQTITAKAYQVKKFEIDYRYFCNIMEYNSNFESAYREKYKIPREQRTLPIKIDTLTSKYFDFITNDNANNPLSVLSSGYNSFINRLKFMEIIRESKFSLTTLDIADELQKSGYKFTESEKDLIAKLKEQDKFTNNPLRKEFMDKNRDNQKEFMDKYKDILKELFEKEKESLNTSMIEKFLKKKGVQLTDSEKKYLNELKEFEKSDYAKEERKFNETNKINNDFVNQFHVKHRQFVNNYFTEKRKNALNENLEKKLGIKRGFATDIMNAQDVCREIVEEMTPVSDSTLKDIQQRIITPFISEYIAYCNQQTKLKIEANKLKTGYVINEVPKTEADKLFDSIMSKYRGKIVYVDFWATWCGPCRSGMEQIKPLKEELLGQNVVFVYITGPSSPQNTWSNLIPEIKGEHYRVSNDEWNYLCSKFNISGIPHYVLVGKKGEIINPSLGHLDNNSLKKELEIRMKE